MKKENPYLRLISGGETISISACKGGKKASLIHAQKTFPGWVDPDFKHWGCNTPQPTTMKADVDVYKMYNDANFKTLFSSLCLSLKHKPSFEELKKSLKENKLIFKSQEQIEKFVQENKQWLCTDGYETFFLFTEEINGEEKFFVARVFVLSGGGVGVCVPLVG